MGKMKKLKTTIQELKESRTGGQIALRGFAYQFLYSCYVILSTNDVNTVFHLEGIEDIDKITVEKNSNKEMKSRHIKLRILEKTDIQEVISFLKHIKAAGIIIDCWEMLDGNFLIDCKGNKKEYKVGNNTDYEYDRHEYNLDEMQEIND